MSRLFAAVYGKAAIALLVLITLSGTVAAQSEAGRISGVVRDQNGSIIPGAVVVIKNDRTAEERTASSNEDGTFSVSGLKPSTYTVTATSAGLARTLTNVQVLVGQEFKVEVVMQPEEVRAIVDVTGGGEAIIDQSSAAIGANVVNALLA